MAVFPLAKLLPADNRIPAKISRPILFFNCIPFSLPSLVCFYTIIRTITLWYPTTGWLCSYKRRVHGNNPFLLWPFCSRWQPIRVRCLRQVIIYSKSTAKPCYYIYLIKTIGFKKKGRLPPIKIQKCSKTKINTNKNVVRHSLTGHVPRGTWPVPWAEGRSHVIDLRVMCSPSLFNNISQKDVFCI
jgi:hypothetical protein